MTIFSELQENTTVVCATHDYGILPQTARILRIEDGKVVEDDKTGEMNNVSLGHCTADFWGISCILITVQIIKIRERKGKNSDKDKNLAKFMVGMIAVYGIFVLIMCSGMKDFMTMMIPTVVVLPRVLDLDLYKYIWGKKYLVLFCEVKCERAPLRFILKKKNNGITGSFFVLFSLL